MSSRSAEAMQVFRGHGAGNLAVFMAGQASGNIVAYLGSEEYYDKENKSAIDYAEVPRSSGSTLKPFIYGLGMSIGGLYVTLADLVRAYGVLANDGRSQLIQSNVAR
ncbi:MAG: hypothetical protein HYX75_08770 [Acidobacteria bacterium]|nr:hypothetical protein [Acidobacteriota bacterium]